MALERFWWWLSLDLLRDSCNSALWLEHWELYALILKVSTKLLFRFKLFNLG